MNLLITPTVAQRFRAKIDYSTPAACWPFTGYTRDGYGVITTRHEGKKYFVPAHQVALHLAGGILEPGQVTRHLCGNPACCNPAHLRPGNQRENMLDCRQHGRIAKGERNGRAILTLEQVAAIRAEPQYWGVNSRLAELYGVHHTTIRDIRKGKIWKEAA